LCVPFDPYVLSAAVCCAIGWALRVLWVVWARRGHAGGLCCRHFASPLPPWVSSSPAHNPLQHQYVRRVCCSLAYTEAYNFKQGDAAFGMPETPLVLVRGMLVACQLVQLRDWHERLLCIRQVAAGVGTQASAATMSLHLLWVVCHLVAACWLLLHQFLGWLVLSSSVMTPVALEVKWAAHVHVACSTTMLCGRLAYTRRGCPLDVEGIGALVGMPAAADTFLLRSLVGSLPPPSESLLVVAQSLSCRECRLLLGLCAAVSLAVVHCSLLQQAAAQHVDAVCLSPIWAM